MYLKILFLFALVVLVSVISLGFLMIIPAHAAVSYGSLEKNSYTIEEQIIFIGKETNDNSSPNNFKVTDSGELAEVYIKTYTNHPL